MDNFKSKALNSTFWSFFETFGNQGIQFVIGIILARLLLPEDYGITGVLAVFVGIAGVLVDSGFKTSIIRSKDITDVDCSTIFYVNLLVSVFTGLLLFVSGEWIAGFFNRPELVNVTKVFALIPFINGLGLVQSALLFKNLQFKLNAKISIASNLISGGFALFLAFKGFSYWALVWRAILSSGIYTTLLWVFSSWRPKLIFSFEILKKHFKFSSRLLLTGILDSFFDNIYSFIFGKYFSFKELGFFTRGKGYVDIVSKTLSVTIQKVNTPLLSSLNKNQSDTINLYFKLLKITCLFIFPPCVMLAVLAKPLILILIGEKWLPAVLYLQLLVISGIIYPIQNANSSLFEVMGESKLILKSTLISRPIQILILAISSNFGTIVITLGIALHSVFMLFLSSYFVIRLINCSIKKIFYNLFPAIIISVSMGFIVSIFGICFGDYFKVGLLLVIQILIGFISLIILMFMVSRKELITIIKIAIPKLDCINRSIH